LIAAGKCGNGRRSTPGGYFPSYPFFPWLSVNFSLRQGEDNLGKESGA
jgi:hypothetical protein